jgi:aminomethyltransferase
VGTRAERIAIVTPIADRQTALHEKHVAAGAKMVDFFGWAMPISYRGIVAEHDRVRTTAGVFDVSHMGQLVVSGPDALQAVELVTTNRASSLKEGRVQYSIMCYENGGIVDDVLVYRLSDRFMLVVNASNCDKDFEWIRSNISGNVTLEDHSFDTQLVAIQGPRAEAVLAKIVDADLSTIAYYHSAQVAVLGRETLVSRTGYTGEDGFEIYCAHAQAGDVWDALLEAGSEWNVEPIGLGARDTLRLEMGYHLYGQDIDETRTPVEAGLSWVVKTGKGDFIGREAILAKMKDDARVRLVGFELKARGVPRPGYRILAGGEDVGVVTSGTHSPSVKKGIGLGYVGPGAGEDLDIEIRGRPVPAGVVETPFYTEGSLRHGK